MTTKLGRDIVPGDRIAIADEDRVVTVTEVAKGILRNTKLVVWGTTDREWSSVPLNAEVEVIP